MIFISLKRLFLISSLMFNIANASDIIATNNVKPDISNTIQEKLAKLESSFDGRIGISAINTSNGERIQYRANERFAFCSTSKLMVVSAILNKSMAAPKLLQKNITYSQKYLEDSGYSPITKKYLATGMSIAKLSEATLEYSDNTAMNLLVKQLGGPLAVTTYARSIGNETFRLDRYEPEINSAIPHDVRDTSTPAAMEKSLQSMVLGNALGLVQREQLITWLKNNTTGNAKIRAGVPLGWIVGDKTGGGDYGTGNDVGIIWPPKCPPIILAIYTTQNKKDAQSNNEVIASATRMLIDAFAKTDKCIKL
jgi:beta-lactamase class A